MCEVLEGHRLGAVKSSVSWNTGALLLKCNVRQSSVKTNLKLVSCFLSYEEYAVYKDRKSLGCAAKQHNTGAVTFRPNIPNMPLHLHYHHCHLQSLLTLSFQAEGVSVPQILQPLTFLTYQTDFIDPLTT